MFFRIKKTKSGSSIQLVESYRDNENRPRQKIILSLGDASLPKELWGQVAEEIENHLKGIRTFLPPTEDVKVWASRILKEIEKKGWTPARAIARNTSPKNTIEIDPANITHRHTTELGPELVALKAWNVLGMDRILTSHGFSSTQIKNSAVSIMNRLLDPCSEHALPEWLNNTSFQELLKHPLRNISRDRFYRLSDKLYKHKDSIEASLRDKEIRLFDLKPTIFLYDATNTFFEGNCSLNPKAKRGKSKEKRTDAPLLAVGLILDSEGFIVRHEVFAGNTHDSTTLFPMINKLQGNEYKGKPTIIVDSGMASEDNLRQLRKKNYDYIVVGKRPTRSAYEEEFQQLPFSVVKGRADKPPVSIAMKDEEHERIVFCYSESRAKKEEAILSKAEEKFVADLMKLKKRFENGQLQTTEASNRALGRILERHPRVTRYYDVEMISGNGKPSLGWQRLNEKYESALQLCGGYYLRSSRKDLDEQTIWKTYMMLTRVESGFRSLKSNLGLRPVYHQLEHRCDSHIFITILAYHMLHWIEHTLRLQGEKRSWVSVRRLLQTHAYTTIEGRAIDGQTFHIRTPGVPDPEQARIYQLLNIDLSTLPRITIFS